MVRRINIGNGNVTTYAGVAGTTGRANGVGTLATFNTPVLITMDSAGTVALIVSYAVMP